MSDLKTQDAGKLDDRGRPTTAIRKWPYWPPGWLKKLRRRLMNRKKQDIEIYPLF